MAEPEWIPFIPESMFPDNLQDLLDSIGELSGVLGTALDTMATVVEIAGEFVQGFVDIQAVAIQAMQDAIDSIIQQLTQSGFYWLFHMPKSYSGPLSISSWTTAVANSVSDIFDERRPILVDPHAYVSAVAVVATASTYKGLLTDYRQMFELFAKRIASATQIARWPDRGDPWVTLGGVGREPNWGSKKLADIFPPLMDVAMELQKFRDVITSTLSGGEIYGAFAAILRNKAALLNAFAAYLLQLLSLIENMLNWEGAYVLPIYGQGDATWFQRIITNARGGPWDAENPQYTAGAVFLATGGTSAQAELLLDLFGLPAVVVETPPEWM